MIKAIRRFKQFRRITDFKQHSQNVLNDVTDIGFGWYKTSIMPLYLLKDTTVYT